MFCTVVHLDPVLSHRSDYKKTGEKYSLRGYGYTLREDCTFARWQH